MRAASAKLSDLNILVAGQGGDGSLTVITLLGRLLAHRGLHLFTSRNVASRIKGGHAAAMLRAGIERRGCLGDQLDVLVAFDAQAVEIAGHQLCAQGVVIFDGSSGPVPRQHLPEGAQVLEVPFGRFAVRDLRRDLFKNSFSFGLLTRVLGLPDKEAVACLEERFGKNRKMVDANLLALNMGFKFAEEFDCPERHGFWQLDRAKRQERILVSGNEAMAFGFLVSGGLFFAGYPITTATDIMDWLAPRLPQFGGVVLQVEDELAAINMAIGAAMTGVRAMTASSGPGMALMQEGISHLGSAEIPLVIVDCQRAGPSTGMPTKPEQGDIAMLAHGGTGDYPRIVLAPGNPDDCFELAVTANNLSQRLQCLVILALDQSVAQDLATTEPFDLDGIKIDKGKRLNAGEVAALEEYRRYLFTEDGVSPWAPPGTPGGMNLITGNERNEFGQVSTAPGNRKKMVDKRARKIGKALDLLPPARRWGDAKSKVGLLGVGMAAGVMAEAARRLAGRGCAVACLQPRTLWPVLDETVDFVREHDRVYVIEHNAEGQLARLLAGAGAPFEKMRHLRRYDGTPFRPSGLYRAVLDGEGAQ